MNTKYFEHIVVYLSVLVVCVIIALFARVVALRLGVDEFTAQIVFWSVVAIGIIIYSILSIYGISQVFLSKETRRENK